MPGTTKQYYLHGILLPGSTWIPVCNSVTPSANIQHILKRAGAAVTPSFRGAAQAAPDISFSTTAIKIILDECTDGDGVSIKDYSAGNVDLYYRLATNLATREPIGDSDHLVVRAKRSCLIWTGLEASETEATIDCRIIPTFDGTNAPLTGIGAQTIAANLNVGAEFGLGPCKLNGTDIDGTSRWRFEQNLDLNIKHGDGLVYPTYVGIRGGDPVLTVDTPDLGKWITPGVAGLQVTALVAYLRKLNSDTIGHVADATEEHISLTATDNPAGMASVNDGTGGVTDEASLGLRIGLRRSAVGTTHPLTIDTTAAIS